MLSCNLYLISWLIVTRIDWHQVDQFQLIDDSHAYTGRSRKAQLSSGWISIRSELSSLNFNASVRAEQSFAIRYPNVVIKSLRGNLEILLNYYANAYTFDCGILFVCFRGRAATESERCLFGSHCSVALFNRFLDFATETRGRECT